MFKIFDITGNGKKIKVVSAKDLFTFLEVTDSFTNWCNKIMQYEFDEMDDYFVVFNQCEGQDDQEKRDYYLSLEMSKHVSLREKSEKSWIGRQHILDFERLVLDTNHPLMVNTITITKN